MLTDCYGHSISTSSVTVLSINVVANIYNLIILQMIGNLEIRKFFLNNDIESKENVIVFETVISLLAILISRMTNTSCLIFTIKFWTFGTTLVVLILDMLLASAIAGNLLLNYTPCDENSIALYNLHLYIVTIWMTYFVFKMYAAYTIFNFGKKLRDDLFSNVRSLNEDVESNTSEQNDSPPPPSYDQCVLNLESAPPPPYSVVQK